MQRTNVGREKKFTETQAWGTRTAGNGKAIETEILNSIPEDEYNLIRPDLELVQLGPHHILHEAGEKIEFAYFLNQGLASLVVLTSDGRSVEPP